MCPAGGLSEMFGKYQDVCLFSEHFTFMRRSFRAWTGAADRKKNSAGAANRADKNAADGAGGMHRKGHADAEGMDKQRRSFCG